MWDTATGAEQQALQQEDEVGAPTFSPDGSLLALRGSSGTTQIWDIRTRQQYAALQMENGYWVLFCPTGSRLAIIYGGKGIDIWDVSVSREEQSVDHGSHL